jgi:hypothetical protein
MIDRLIRQAGAMLLRLVLFAAVTTALVMALYPIGLLVERLLP